MLNDNKILLVHPLGYKADAAGRDISRIANITASTTIQVWVSATSSPAAGTIADLVVGKMASAEGKPAADGSINAIHIKVGPAMPPPPQDDVGQNMMWHMQGTSTQGGTWNTQVPPPPPQGGMMGHEGYGGY